MSPTDIPRLLQYASFARFPPLEYSHARNCPLLNAPTRSDRLSSAPDRHRQLERPAVRAGVSRSSPGTLALAVFPGVERPGIAVHGRRPGRGDVVRDRRGSRALRWVALGVLHSGRRPCRGPGKSALRGARGEHIRGHRGGNQPVRQPRLAPRVSPAGRSALAHQRSAGGGGREPVGRDRLGRPAPGG